MKELSVEEKVKAYDKALEIIIDYYQKIKYSSLSNASTDREVLEKAFPELAESEDEKIRESLLEYLHTLPNHYAHCGVCAPEWIAWLEKQGQNFTKKDVDDAYLKGISDAKQEIEKQGEKKPTDNRLIPQKGEYYVCIKDYYFADGNTTNTRGKIYKSPCDGYINDDRGFGLSWINSCTENFFRPVKKEDVIVCEQNNVIGKPFQCKEFISKVIQQNIKSLEDKGIVPNFRLWDISDAKEGDILFAKGSYFKEYTFIYSGMTEDNVISTYCGFDMVHNNFDTKLSRFGRMEDFEAVYPATKEQRDQLEKAMADAGYKWNKEKLKLEKI